MNCLKTLNRILDKVRANRKKRFEAWREKNFERIILPAGTPLRGMMLKQKNQMAALHLLSPLWAVTFFLSLFLALERGGRSEVIMLCWCFLSVVIAILFGCFASSLMLPQIPNGADAKGSRLISPVRLATAVAFFGLCCVLFLYWMIRYMEPFEATGILKDEAVFTGVLGAVLYGVGVWVLDLLDTLCYPRKLDRDTVAFVPRTSFTDRAMRRLRIFAFANAGVFLVLTLLFPFCILPYFLSYSGDHGDIAFLSYLLFVLLSFVGPIPFVMSYDSHHPAIATAQSDRRRPWWKRLFLFLSEPTYKVVEFPAGFRMRAYVWRQRMGMMVFMGICCFAMILVDGFEPQRAPLLFPIVYVALLLLSAYGVVASVFRPRSLVECPFLLGHANEKFLSLLFSPRTNLLYSRRYAVLEEKTAFLCLSGAGSRVMYIVVFAGLSLALLSTPFRPMPLEPPPSRLMASVHPCLLDENGDVRAPKTIVVDGVRTVDDVMNVVTNSGRPEFQVAAAFLAFQDRLAPFRNALGNLKMLAETNVVEKADLDACSELGQCVAELERLLEIAAAAQGPQFGPGAVVPEFASSRRDYVERDRSVFLPVFSSLLASCSSLLSAARDERDLVHALSLIQRVSDASFNIFISNDVPIFLSIRNRAMTGAALSLAERLAISSEGADAMRQAFGDGSAEEMCLREHVQGANLGLAAWAPASGTSYWKALRASFDGSSIVPFGLKGYDLQTAGFMIYLSGVLWSPAAAALCGYDVDAQLATMKARRQWVAVAASCALDADSRDRLSEAYRQARFASLFCRGGMLGIVDEKAWRVGVFESQDCARRFPVARYSDGCAIVADVALRLSQFRGEKGRDAESLAEVEEALGWKPETDSDLEVFYEPIPAPEGAAEGTFAYALGLKPKAGCRKAFENTGDAWLVVRNPNFAGTLKRRFFHFEQYNGHRKLDWDWRVADKANKDAPFALPRSLFCDDPAELEEAVGTLEAKGWSL